MRYVPFSESYRIYIIKKKSVTERDLCMTHQHQIPDQGSPGPHAERRFWGNSELNSEPQIQFLSLNANQFELWEKGCYIYLERSTDVVQRKC